MSERQVPDSPTVAEPKTREEVRADQRRRLIDAMYEIACRDGLNGARIQDIAREARVSLRTFYAEFDSKEQCFLALHEEIAVRVREILAGALDFSKPWRDIIHDGFTAYFGALAEQPMLTRAITVELATLSDEARQYRERTMIGYADMLVQLVEYQRSQHPNVASQALTPLMARAMIGSMTEMINSRVFDGKVETMPELVDTATEMLWRLVMCPPSDASGFPAVQAAGA